MRFLIAFCALAGIVVSTLALRVHYSNDVQPCDINARWDCGIVNHSRYAEVQHIPVAAIGIAGYLLIGLLALMSRRTLMLGCRAPWTGLRPLPHPHRSAQTRSLLPVLRHIAGNHRPHRPLLLGLDASTAGSQVPPRILIPRRRGRRLSFAGTCFSRLFSFFPTCRSCSPPIRSTCCCTDTSTSTISSSASCHCSSRAS